MRVLLDECVPRALRRELLGHEVKTVAEAGWAGVQNGELLQLAAKQFDLLLTVDRNLEYQQNFAGLDRRRRCRWLRSRRHLKRSGSLIGVRLLRSTCRGSRVAGESQSDPKRTRTGIGCHLMNWCSSPPR